MLRFWGFVTAVGLVFAGVAQAILNGFAPDGLTLILCIAGLAVAVVVWLTDTEYIADTHPDGLGSLDLKERGIR